MSNEVKIILVNSVQVMKPLILLKDKLHLLV